MPAVKPIPLYSGIQYLFNSKNQVKIMPKRIWQKPYSKRWRRQIKRSARKLARNVRRAGNAPGIDDRQIGEILRRAERQKPPAVKPPKVLRRQKQLHLNFEESEPPQFKREKQRLFKEEVDRRMKETNEMKMLYYDKNIRRLDTEFEENKKKIISLEPEFESLEERRMRLTDGVFGAIEADASPTMRDAKNLQKTLLQELHLLERIEEKQAKKLTPALRDTLNEMRRGIIKNLATVKEVIKGLEGQNDFRTR